MTNRYNKILLIIGLFLINLIIYNRIIRERIPQKFDAILFIVAFLISVVMFVLLLSAIFRFYKHYLNKKNNNFKYMTLLYESKYNPFKIAYHSMIEFDSFLKNKIPYYNQHERYTDLFFKVSVNKILNKKYKIICIILLFCVIPQIIVCGSFIFDILFNEKFIYFYKNIWLLFLPLLLNYYIYSIKIFIETNLHGLNAILILRIIPSHKLTVNSKIDDFFIVTTQEWQLLLATPEGNNYTCYNMLSDEILKSFEDDLLSANATLNFCLDFLNILFRMKSYSQIYDSYKKVFDLSFNILKYLIFLIGWVYILYSTL